MTERVAAPTGLFPAVDSSESGALSAVDRFSVDCQRAAGLDRFVEGQRGWTDRLAHPLSVHDATEAGPERSYFDTGATYREPRVTGDLRPDGTVAAELGAAAALLADDESLQAVLPDPYTLAGLARDDHYGDEAEFLAAVAEFLAAEVEQFPAHETLTLLAPGLVVDPPGDGADARASDAVDTVAAATDAEVVLQSYWGSYEEKPYAHLMDAGIDAFGFDFVAGDRDTTLYTVTEFGTKDSIALGLVDAGSTGVPEPETVAERVDWVLDRIPSQTFDTVHVTPNAELAGLPADALDGKLRALAGAVGEGGDR